MFLSVLINLTKKLYAMKELFNNIKKFKGVTSSIIGLGGFWLITSLISINVLVHTQETLHLSINATVLIAELLFVGILLGSWCSKLITKKRLEMGIVNFAGIGLTITTFLLGCTDLTTIEFILIALFTAFLGGFFRSPLSGWIKQRTTISYLRETLGYTKITAIVFMLCGTVCFYFLQTTHNSYFIFRTASLLFRIATLISIIKMPIGCLRFILWALSKIIYRTRITGIKNIPLKSGAIIVSNHVSILDVLLLTAAAPRNLRFVMHDKVFNAPVIGWVFKNLNMIPISGDSSKKGLLDFNERCKKEVESGHIVCIFPEGELSRNGQLAGFKKGIEHLAKTINAPIIPMHMHNLIGTPLTIKTGTNKKYGFNFKTLQKKVYITIGEPLNKIESAFKLRQLIKELELINVSKSIAEKSLADAIFEIKKPLFKNCSEIVKSDDLTLKNLIINTPNYEVQDLVGNIIKLTGSKANSIGKPIPGVIIKAVDEFGKELDCYESGTLFIKHCFTNFNNWYKLNLKGYVDESGFITLTP